MMVIPTVLLIATIMLLVLVVSTRHVANDEESFAQFSKTCTASFVDDPAFKGKHLRKWQPWMTDVFTPQGSIHCTNACYYETMDDAEECVEYQQKKGTLTYQPNVTQNLAPTRNCVYGEA